MSTKTFFDKKQAVVVLIQIESGRGSEMNVFEQINEDHKYFKLSCDELEKKLMKYIDPDGFVGVVENV